MTRSTHTTWHPTSVQRIDREGLLKHKSTLIWLTGLSGSGKSTLANALAIHLHQQGIHTFVLDGDNIRHGLSADLGFSNDDRQENMRRLRELAKLFIDAGIVTIAAFISPFEKDRQALRKFIGEDLIEVYCDCPLDACEARDVKGLYQKARRGQIAQFTGISSPYEPPASPTITLRTNHLDVTACVDRLVALLHERGILPSSIKNTQ